ncbi:MAG: hypothetical protein LC723_14275, partial [Actinobacteria bacterium]|nr:hypothetical protein [Actinomycetota bacterium]
MATYLAAANGNLTAGATWAAVDSTSLLDAQDATTTLTTSLIASSTFTPGAITIDGIAVKIAGRAAVASGTMTVELSTGGVQVTGTSVTINVSDIPVENEVASTTLCPIGWTFFKFGSPVLLLAATLYAVRATTSVGGQVDLFRNSTAANWSRMLRTTTTGVAPTTGDRMFICGEWTAAATKTDRAVVMDSTAATDYGDATTAQIAT